MVTGGAGFIGSNVVDEYIRLGHQVVIIDDLSSGKKEYINKNATFYQADIQKRIEVEKIFQKEKPEVLNHHAAQMSVRKSVEDPLLDANINIIGLLNLLEESKKNKLKKVIFASSGGAIYGDAKKIPTAEEYEPKIPLSPYGIAKYSSELYLQYYFLNFTVPYIALRYSNVYGPRQNPDGEAGVVAIFAKKLLNNDKPVINGDGKQTRDYIYVEDVVKANVNALKKDFVGPVNVATSIETDVQSIFTMLSSINNSNIKPILGPSKKGEQKRSCLDIKKAKTVLEWSPEITVKEGLAQTINFFRSK